MFNSAGGAAFSQKDRSLTLDSPLGEQNVLLTEVRGVEAISTPFHFDIEFATSHKNEDVTDLLGKAVTLWLCHEKDADRRPVNGLVRRLSGPGPGPHGFRMWRAEIVPRLAFLSYSMDCRIFQHKTIPDILKDVFEDHGLTSHDIKGLTGTYPKLDYCVQYRETALDFVSRLMEHVGLYYWHEHQNDEHKLVISDNVHQAPAALDGTAKLQRTTQFCDIDSLANEYAFRPGKWTMTDYDFKSPSLSLLADTSTNINHPGMKRYEMFDYPGTHSDRSGGSALTRVRMEHEEAEYQRLTGKGRRALFAGGSTVDIGQDDRDALELPDKLLLTEVRHHATDRTQVSEGAAAPTYDNEFVAIPAKTPFRPERRTPKPFVRGIQSAVVMGPPGEPIHTDKYGRVKVRFFWDRNPADNSDEHRSCWLRVSQSWADGGFGAVHLPRVGQEVIVDFMEGDPDRPIITGRVYNGDKSHPFNLPAEKAKSGFKTKSLNGSGYNQISMDDTDGAEQVLLHAAMDLLHEVENDMKTIVNNNQDTTVANNQVSNVGGSVTTNIGGASTTDIGAVSTTNIGADSITDIAGASFTNIVGASTTNVVGASMSLLGGGSMTVIPTMSLGLTGQSLGVTGQDTSIVGQSMSINAMSTSIIALAQSLNVISMAASGVSISYTGVAVALNGLNLGGSLVNITQDVFGIEEDELKLLL